jgi:hypothetical protein
MLSPFLYFEDMNDIDKSQTSDITFNNDFIIFGTSSCFEFWWFELMVINVVFQFGPVELMVGM